MWENGYTAFYRYLQAISSRIYRPDQYAEIKFDTSWSESVMIRTLNFCI